jgi:hypothetical protein
MASRLCPRENTWYSAPSNLIRRLLAIGVLYHKFRRMVE